MAYSNDVFLKQAFSKGYDTEVVRATLKAGANPDEIVDNLGNTAILHLIQRTFSSRVTLIDLLLAKGADPDKTNPQGKTPLHRAAICTIGMTHGTEIMETLLKHKADLHKTDPKGNTPLHDAVEGWLRSNKPQNVLFLLKAGADIHRKNDAGLSPLDIAVNHRKTPEAKMAVKKMFNEEANARRAKEKSAQETTAAKQKQLRDLARKTPGLKIKK